MGLSNYSQLQASIAAWLNRADLTSNIPDFIALTEAKINRKIDHRQMVGYTQIGISSNRATLPDDFTGWRSGRILESTSPKLEYETLDAYANRANDSGVPVKFTLAGDYALFEPNPDGAYTLELFYDQQIPPLSENGGNWLLDAFPDVYLYGALAEAAPYMVDDDRAQMWVALFEKAVAEVNSDGQTQISGGTMQTSNGQVRVY